MTEKERRAERNKRYYERQRNRGFEMFQAYVEPDIKRKLEELAKEHGSYNAGLEKLFSKQDHSQAA